MEIRCRICQSANIRFYGNTVCHKIAVSSENSQERSLYKCNQCRSISVEPVPGAQELSAYYENYARGGKSGQILHNRKSLAIIRQLAAVLGQGKVLDLGCGCGDILACLPSSFEKVGVDMAAVACQEAAKKGIEVWCAPWEEVDFSSEFDLVIALDFLEHVSDTAGALGKISKVLKRGGYIIIETGNADSWAAKTLREDWYYPAVYGHLQVLSPGALVDLAKMAQIEPISLVKGVHTSEAIKQILYRGLLSYGFHLMKLASSALESVISDHRLFRKFLYRAPPAAILGDHMIMIGQKRW